MSHSEEQLGATLDALIAAQQKGQSPVPVPAEVAEEAVLADQLLQLAEQVQPDEVEVAAMSVQPATVVGNHRRPARTWLSVPWDQRRMLPGWLGLRRLALPGLVLLALVLAVLANPGTRALAQDILQFFRRSDSDTTEVRLTSVPPSPLPPSTDAPATVEGPPAVTATASGAEATRVEPAPSAEAPRTLDAEFPLTLGEAAAEAGYSVQVPTLLPEGFEFRGARFDVDRQAIEQYFALAAHTGPVMTPQFTLIQQSGPFDSLIGPSAVIDSVTVGDVPGEYVAGGWLYNPTGTLTEADGTVVQQFVWERTMVPLQTLRWALGGFFFELAFIGSDTQYGYLDTEDLVALAASVR
jgi:hypothetical protein